MKHGEDQKERRRVAITGCHFYGQKSDSNHIIRAEKRQKKRGLLQSPWTSWERGPSHDKLPQSSVNVIKWTRQRDDDEKELTAGRHHRLNGSKPVALKLADIWSVTLGLLATLILSFLDPFVTSCWDSCPSTLVGKKTHKKAKQMTSVPPLQEDSVWK